ncbi:sensor histidine kinase [Telmatospirillum sp. J64-1]|uniref:sensor histidine kinase n=1 Tax=Telmatospirillum sp. J64-1 TaxID=2502183 RepID=UPI00115F087C|nr:histidine kinase dimerization/phosphoacceptor domain -containing protein [Telmatospirillum sp. J64-1]
MNDQEEQFKLLADNAPVMIWRSSPDKMCDFFNKPWLEFTGRAAAEEMGMGWSERVHPDDFDRCLRIYTTAFDAREEFSMPYRLLRHDGCYRWLLDNGRPYYHSNGEFAGYFGSCIDVTDMKQALEDKDVLLREVHHRVRNNMQLVCSLLELQATRSPEPVVKESLKEAGQRVRSIALAQEALHDGTHFSAIDLSHYLETLLNSVGHLVPRDRITLKFHAEPAQVPLDRAVPLGLIVNELLSNAAKHAFPDGRSGTITLSLARKEDGTTAITVADDGIGRSADKAAAPSARSLGKQLIAGLAGQANARVSFDDSEGMKAEILLLPA